MNENVVFFLKFKKDIHYFYDTLSLSQALPLMKEYGFTAVPVVNAAGEYIGSVSEGDFLWHILANKTDSQSLSNVCLKDIIRPDFMPAVNISVPFEQLLAFSFNQNYVPVVDDRNIFIGIVTRQTLMKYLAGRHEDFLMTPTAIEDLTGFQIHF